MQHERLRQPGEGRGISKEEPRILSDVSRFANPLQSDSANALYSDELELRIRPMSRFSFMADGGGAPSVLSRSVLP